MAKTKSISNRSTNGNAWINVIGIIFCLFAVFTLFDLYVTFVGISNGLNGTSLVLIFSITSILLIVSAVGLFMKRKWGRILSLIMIVLLILNRIYLSVTGEPVTISNTIFDLIFIIIGLYLLLSKKAKEVLR